MISPAPTRTMNTPPALKRCWKQERIRHNYSAVPAERTTPPMLFLPCCKVEALENFTGF